MLDQILTAFILRKILAARKCTISGWIGLPRLIAAASVKQGLVFVHLARVDITAEALLCSRLDSSPL